MKKILILLIIFSSCNSWVDEKVMLTHESTEEIKDKLTGEVFKAVYVSVYNRSDQPLFFNVHYEQTLLMDPYDKKYFPITRGVYLLWKDVNNNLCNVSNAQYYQFDKNSIQFQNFTTKPPFFSYGNRYLYTYKRNWNSNNFILNPGQKIFFEYLITPSQLRILKETQRRHGQWQIKLVSDSTNCKNSLLRSELITIQQSKCAMYHGVLTTNIKL